LKKHTTLFSKEIDFREYLPIITPIEGNKYKTNIWDIPFSIKKISYLTHSHYRYYGKFPSVVAGQILDELKPPSDEYYVLDNFCGSGTTLVEAKLRGIDSIGIDISWLSVMASNIKSAHIDIKTIKKELLKLTEIFDELQQNIDIPIDDFTSKWFSIEATRDLACIQEYLVSMKESQEKHFLLIAFIGIVRRVSKAHDGEVRPHINKNKRVREVLPAYSKKVIDMCNNHIEFMAITDENIISKCIHGNNLELSNIKIKKKCYLAISHPPYLNSFNYAPVYNLEFYWGRPFEEKYSKAINFHKNELKAHPASEKITQGYFEHLRKCYLEVYNLQEVGSYLVVVIGDCTRNGKVIPVIDNLVDIIENIGYKVHEINYRTTHYSLGKYAYKHRADYHGDEAEKKDGVLIFKK